MKSRYLLAIPALTCALGVQAETTKPWSVAAELGVIATSGNTETTSVQAKLDVKQLTERWHNHYVFSALFKEDQIKQEDDTKLKEKTAEKYFGSVKSAYQLDNENSNLFVYGSHTEDKFGAYRSYSTLAMGYGTRLYETDTMKLDVEVGPGYFWGEKVLPDDVIERERGALLRGAAAFLWQMTETAEFNQTLSVESAKENTRSIAESSVTTRINGALQLKVGLNVAHNSDVAPDKKKTDTTTYVNLVYKF